MSQITGEPGVQHEHGRVQHVRPGRLAVCVDGKLLYGVRYDVYKYPDGLADAPLAQTHEFNIDRNNFGPSVGVAWSLDRDDGGPRPAPASCSISRSSAATSRRCSSRVRRAHRLTRSTARRQAAHRPSRTVCQPERFAAIAMGGRSGLPGRAYLAEQRAGRARVRQRSDRAIGGDVRQGSQLPVVTDINLINPIRTLADGRPVYSTTPSAPRLVSILGSTISPRCSPSASRRSSR